jgi:hypothetical protein
MIATPLAVPETDRIADLLAEITGRTIARPPVVLAPTPEPAAIPIDDAVPQTIRASVRQMLDQANWRNEAPRAERQPATGLAIGPTDDKPVPLPAPFGVLTVATLFGLINWRNRPDEARPLPMITPPPGAEFTVEAMMPTFGWE